MIRFIIVNPATPPSAAGKTGFFLLKPPFYPQTAADTAAKNAS